MVVANDLATYDVFREACLLPDDNVQGFTTQLVLEAAKLGGPT